MKKKKTTATGRGGGNKGWGGRLDEAGIERGYGGSGGNETELKR